MRPDLHLSERTVVFTTAMMFALGNGTLNRTICVAMTIHDFSSFALIHQVDKTGCLIETFVPSERLAVLSSRNKSISPEIHAALSIINNHLGLLSDFSMMSFLLCAVPTELSEEKIDI